MYKIFPILFFLQYIIIKFVYNKSNLFYVSTDLTFLYYYIYLNVHSFLNTKKVGIFKSKKRKRRRKWEVLLSLLILSNLGSINKFDYYYYYNYRFVKYV